MENLHFLEQGARGIEEHRVTIIPAPLAGSVSWMGGTDHGPRAILEASDTLELLDDELLVETFKAGIRTLPIPDYAGLTSTEVCESLSWIVENELVLHRLPVILGGEHTVTLPAVAACCRYHPDLTVLQIDAHLDLRDSYGDDILSHACVMRRLDDLAIPFVQVGMRSFSRPEYELVLERGWQPFFMQRIDADEQWIEKICNSIKGPVYITFDCDGLDPAIMPATGTPEPHGLTWLQVTALFKRLIADHKVVGLDFVEFSPIAGGHHAAYTMAKLIYRTLGYIFAPELFAMTDRT